MLSKLRSDFGSETAGFAAQRADVLAGRFFNLEMGCHFPLGSSRTSISLPNRPSVASRRIPALSKDPITPLLSRSSNITRSPPMSDPKRDSHPRPGVVLLQVWKRKWERERGAARAALRRGEHGSSFEQCSNIRRFFVANQAVGADCCFARSRCEIEVGEKLRIRHLGFKRARVALGPEARGEVFLSFQSSAFWAGKTANVSWVPRAPR